MLTNALMLAQDAASEPAPPGMFVMEWYSWVAIILIPVVLIGYKVYKNKTMS